MMWDYVTPGIPDSYFETDEAVPMTKEEVRALILSKARIRRGDRFLDVGCGTGTVTVEAALLVGESGRVYSIDKSERAIRLTRSNLERFGILDRAILIHGEAPEAIREVREQIDVAFVGGGSKRVHEILAEISRRIRPGGRVVVSAVLLETAIRALSSLEELGFHDVDVVEVIVAKGRKIEAGTMMISHNPIFIVSGRLA